MTNNIDWDDPIKIIGDRKYCVIEGRIDASNLDTTSYGGAVHLFSVMETKWMNSTKQHLTNIRAWDEESRRQALTLEVGAIVDLLIEKKPDGKGGNYRHLVVANANQYSPADQEAIIDAYYERNKQRGGSSTAPEKAKATPAPTPVAPKPVVTPGRENSIERQVACKDATTWAISSLAVLALPDQLPDGGVNVFSIWDEAFAHFLARIQDRECDHCEKANSDTLNEEDLGLF